MLGLDRASLGLGFSVSPAGLDSVWADVSGAGHLDMASGNQLAANGAFAFKRISADNWVSGNVGVNVGAVTVTEALETVTELLPGDWTLPSDAESFDVLGLDRAALGLGFSVSPAGLDSVWAGLSGAGHLVLASGNQMEASGAFSFKRVSTDTWVAGNVGVNVGAVTVTEALETVTELLPGDWALPSDAESFDVLGLDRASLALGFSVSPAGLDSVWAGVDGAGHLDVGDDQLSADGHFAFKRVSTDMWVSGHVGLSVGSVTLPEALNTVTNLMPGDWALPDDVENFDVLGIDHGSLGLGFSASPAGLDSIWANVRAQGHMDVGDGQLVADGAFVFRQIATDTWVSGQVGMRAGEMSVVDALNTVTDLMPGDWALPDEMNSFDALALDHAALGLGFSVSPLGLDSVWANVSGAGHLDIANQNEPAQANGAFSFRLINEDTWVAGSVGLSFGEMSVVDALGTVTNLMPGDWALPDEMNSFDALALDGASLGLGFSASPMGLDSIWANVSGAGHLDIANQTEPARADGAFFFRLINSDTWVAGNVGLALGEMSVVDALATVTNLMPGDWALPDEMSSFDALALDRASLGLGFSASPLGLDSLWADMSGAGHLDIANQDEPARANGTFSFRLLGTEPYVAANVGLTLGEMSVVDALGTVANLIPGEVALPEEMNSFDAIALDNASFGLGFSASPLGLDSIWANVRGAGHLDVANQDEPARADGAFSFRLVNTDTWVAGDIGLTLSEMSVVDALGTVANLIPGDVSLPDEMNSFDAIALDGASLGLGFSASPMGLDSIWANVHGAGHLDIANQDEPARANGAFSFRLIGADPWVSGSVGLTLGEMSVVDALGTVTNLIPGDVALPDEMNSFDAIALDRASLNLGFGAGPLGLDSIYANVSGAGHLDVANQDEPARAEGEFSFRLVNAETWVAGNVGLTLGEMSVVDALGTATNLIPGDVALPDEMNSFDAIALDRAVLGLGFSASPAGVDSLWANVSGAGHLDIANQNEPARADGAFSFLLINAETWVAGDVGLTLSEMSVVDALGTVTNLMPGDWALPDEMNSLDALALDRASLGLGFAASPLGLDSLWANINGAGHLDVANQDEPASADGAFSFRLVNGETWVASYVGITLGEMSIVDALETVTGLIPGDVTLPDEMNSLDALALDRGSLGLGFSASPLGLDSIWANVSGAGHLDVVNQDEPARADGAFSFRLVDTDTWLAGNVGLTLGEMSVVDALETVTNLIPGDVALPDEMDSFDALALDRASLGLGFSASPVGLDSIWANVSGAGHLDVANQDEPARADGAFSFRLVNANTWVAGNVGLTLGEMTVVDAVETMTRLVPGDLSLPDEMESLDAVALDRASLGLGFSASPTGLDSIWANVSGAGHLDIANQNEAVRADGAFSFRMIDTDTWVAANVGLSLGEMSVVDALQTVTNLIPGDIALPDEMNSLDAVALDRASLGLGFSASPVGLDSIWANVGGAGHLDIANQDEPARADGAFSFRLVGPDTWVAGNVGLSVGEMSIVDALTTVTNLVPGDWALPEGMDSFDVLALDRAALGLGFSASPLGLDSIWANVSGAGHLDVGEDALTADGMFSFRRVDVDNYVMGSVNLSVGEVTLVEALTTVTDLMPGDWELPESMNSMDVLALDRASLGLGFSVEPVGSDSVWANVSGAGHLDVGESQLTADGTFSFRQVDANTWVFGSVGMSIGRVTLTDALETVASLLPGDWAMPEGMDSFDVLALDHASLGLGFSVDPVGTDSIWADVSGAGHLDVGEERLEADGRFSFRRINQDMWASGSLGMRVGQVTANDALQAAAELLPGDWAMPDDLPVLDALALDSAGLSVGFDTRADSVGAGLYGAGHVGSLVADANIAFVHSGQTTFAAGGLSLSLGAISATEAINAVGELLPGGVALPDNFTALDNLGLDSAGLFMGFDTRSDSAAARVYGAGHVGQLTASANLEFTHFGTTNWAAGGVELMLGEVTATEAINSVAQFLPGSWGLPEGFTALDELGLDSAGLRLGFDTRSDSISAAVFGAGHIFELEARARLEFVHASQTTYAAGGVDLVMGSVTATEAINSVGRMLPGSFTLPENFDALDDIGLDSAGIRLGFDTRADSVGAGVFGAGRFLDLRASAQLAFMHRGSRDAAGASTSVGGSFTLDVGTVDLPRALELAGDLLPGNVEFPEPDFSLGAITDVEVDLGFMVGTGADSAWAELGGGFQIANQRGAARLAVALGSGGPNARFEGSLEGRLGVVDVVNMLSELVPGGGLNLPAGGPLDLAITESKLVIQLGAQSQFSVSGVAEAFGIEAHALFAIANVGGSPELVAGVLVPSLGFGDLVPALENPVTDVLALQNAGMVITTASGTVPSSELAPEVRDFYGTIHGSDTFTLEFQPGLNLFAGIPLDEGPLSDLLDLLSPDAGGNALTLEGNIPIFGGGLDALYFKAELPPMAPPGSPEWFVGGQLSLEITGRPSVGVMGALIFDIMGDTVAFDITSTLAIVPEGGVELSISGGMTAESGWVGPFGINWLTLNQVRLAMSITPATVGIGFRGDAIFGTKDINVAAGLKILYASPPPVPAGVIVEGESQAGMALGDITAFQRQIAGEGALLIPTDALPDIALKDMRVKVATYDDPAIDVSMGVGLAGSFHMSPAPRTPLEELGVLDIDISKNGIRGYGRINPLDFGPVKLDTALIDLALTLEEQHLFLKGGAEIVGLFDGHIDLALTKDSFAFETEVEVFNAFRAALAAKAAFDLANPRFQAHFALYNDFGDEVAYEVIRLLLPVGDVALDVAEGSLNAAAWTLDRAEDALTAWVRLAEEAPRVAMNAAYAAYRYSNNKYNYSLGKYRYYRSRCNWWGPVWACGGKAYWGTSTGFWYLSKQTTWGAYVAARFVYNNRRYIWDNPVYHGMVRARNAAEVGVNAAQAEVAKVREAFNSFSDYVTGFETCRTCPMPPLPFSIKSAEFDAALEGWMGNTSVDMRLDYQVFGRPKVFQLGWSGSIVENAVNLFNMVRNEIFP